MPSFAQITILGNVGNVSPYFLPSGTKLIRFTVAVNKKVIKKDGTEEFKTDWFNVRTTKEWVEEKIKQGDLVMVIGTPEFFKYNDKEYMSIWAYRVFKMREKLEQTEPVEPNNNEPATTNYGSNDEPPF